MEEGALTARKKKIDEITISASWGNPIAKSVRIEVSTRLTKPEQIIKIEELVNEFLDGLETAFFKKTVNQESQQLPQGHPEQSLDQQKTN